VRIEARLAQEAQQVLGGPPQRVSLGNAGEVLHRAVPGNDGQMGVGDDNRVVQTLDETVSEVVHGPHEYN
jgi:hypothetical protein